MIIYSRRKTDTSRYMQQMTQINVNIYTIDDCRVTDAMSVPINS